MFCYELEDAAEALESLLQEVDRDDFGEADLRIGLGQVYAHLNRVWHMRNADAESVLNTSEEQREAWTQFPTDLEPVG